MLFARSSEAVLFSAPRAGGSDVLGEPPLRAVKVDMLGQLEIGDFRSASWARERATL